MIFNESKLRVNVPYYLHNKLKEEASKNDYPTLSSFCNILIENFLTEPLENHVELSTMLCEIRNYNLKMCRCFVKFTCYDTKTIVIKTSADTVQLLKHYAENADITLTRLINVILYRAILPELNEIIEKER